MAEANAKADALATAVDRLTQMVEALGVNVGQLVTAAEESAMAAAPLMAMLGLDGRDNAIEVPGLLVPPPQF